MMRRKLKVPVITVMLFPRHRERQKEKNDSLGKKRWLHHPMTVLLTHSQSFFLHSLYKIISLCTQSSIFGTGNNEEKMTMDKHQMKLGKKAQKGFTTPLSLDYTTPTAFLSFRDTFLI